MLFSSGDAAAADPAMPTNLGVWRRSRLGIKLIFPLEPKSFDNHSGQNLDERAAQNIC
jgi:hypothetical protein